MAKDAYNTITHSLFSKSGIVATGNGLGFGKGKFTTPFPHALNRDYTPRVVDPAEVQNSVDKGFVEVQATTPRKVYEAVRKALHL